MVFGIEYIKVCEKNCVIRKISTSQGKPAVLELLFSLLVLFFKSETPAEVFSGKFFEIFGRNFLKQQFRAAASMTAEFIKVGNKATNILMSLL